MARSFQVPVQLNMLPPRQLAFESLASAPANAIAGSIYFDSTLGWARYCLVGATPGPAVWLDLKQITAAQLSDLASVVKAYRLDEFAAPTNPVSFGSQRATNGADPIGALDFTTMQWVQAYVAARVNGMDWKDSVRAVSDANVTLSAPPATIDGVSLTAGDRILLTAQTTASQNGIYIYGATLTRATDADSSAKVTANLACFISEGTLYADTAWQLKTNDPIVLGTTALTFGQFGTGTAYSAQSPISLVGNQFQLGTVPIAKGGTGGTDAATARTNLGLAQKGFASDVPAMTAGVAVTVAHGLGTDDLVVQVRLKSTGQLYEFDITMDATNVTILSSVTTTAGQFRLVALPVV